MKKTDSKQQIYRELLHFLFSNIWSGIVCWKKSNNSWQSVLLKIRLRAKNLERILYFREGKEICLFMRKIVLPLLVLSQLLPVSGQKTYLKSPGTLTVNENILDNGSIKNAATCQVKKGGVIYEYGPDELIEYKLKDGRVYCSREIEINGNRKSVFLERMTNGVNKLYYYREAGFSTHFIETEGNGLVELPENTAPGNPDYRDILRNITSDRPDMGNMLEVVPYHKDYLGDFISRYENNMDTPFPHLRYGLTAGPAMVKFRANSEMFVDYFEMMDFRYQGGVAFGAFLDNPINHSDFSLHAELLFTAMRYEHNQEVDIAGLDFTVRHSSLKLPVLIRYAFPWNSRVRPYLNIGGSIETALRNDDLLVITALSEPAFDHMYTGNLYKNLYGFTAGGGVEIRLSMRNALFFELRSSSMTGLFSPVSKSLKTSEIYFLSGINF